MGAPIALLVTSILLAILAKLWRTKIPSAALAAPAALTIAAAALLAPVTDPSWFGAILVFVGSAQVLVGLVAWRLWFRPSGNRIHAFYVAPLVSLLALAPAVPMAFGGYDGTSAFDPVMETWAIAGWWGVPALTLFAVFVVEALVRRRSIRRADPTSG